MTLRDALNIAVLLMKLIIPARFVLLMVAVLHIHRHLGAAHRVLRTNIGMFRLTVAPVIAKLRKLQPVQLEVQPLVAHRRLIGIRQLMPAIRERLHRVLLLIRQLLVLKLEEYGMVQIALSRLPAPADNIGMAQAVSRRRAVISPLSIFWRRCLQFLEVSAIYWNRFASNK